jgi:methylated-DNA-protein-cysteine methyltransferase-like protein
MPRGSTRKTPTTEASFADRVKRVVRRIPPGKVIAYGGVAAILGAPRAARGVGNVLSTLPEGTDVPWWRVVNASGAISIHGYPGLLQRMMLEAEGVRFGRRDRIDWRRFGWRPD